MTRRQFLLKKPYLLEQFTNQLGQEVSIYEDPDQPEMPVIAMIDDVISHTSFYDCEDFYEDSEYNPVLTEDRTIKGMFETLN